MRKGAVQDVIALTRGFGAVGGDVEREMTFYGECPVYDLSAMGIGVFEGRDAIYAFLTEWMKSYDAYEEEMLDVVDLGNGVAFASVRESAVPAGSSTRARVHSVYGFLIEWVDGKIDRLAAFPSPDDARSAAEQLAAANRHA